MIQSVCDSESHKYGFIKRPCGLMNINCVQFSLGVKSLIAIVGLF